MRKLLILLTVLIPLCCLQVGCALTPEEKRDIVREIKAETRADGTPLTPEETADRIEEKGAERKKSKGWGIALVLLQAALMIGGSLTKKAVL
jgi:hypothetical protein